MLPGPNPPQPYPESPDYSSPAEALQIIDPLPRAVEARYLDAENLQVFEYQLQVPAGTGVTSAKSAVQIPARCPYNHIHISVMQNGLSDLVVGLYTGDKFSELGQPQPWNPAAADGAHREFCPMWPVMDLGSRGGRYLVGSQSWDLGTTQGALWLGAHGAGVAPALVDVYVRVLLSFKV